MISLQLCDIYSDILANLKNQVKSTSVNSGENIQEMILTQLQVGIYNTSVLSLYLREYLISLFCPFVVLLHNL